MLRIIVVGAAIVASGTAAAQDTYYWPVSGSATQSAQMTQFPMGTPVTLITRTEVNTKQARPGDRVYLEVAESLSYRGQIVVPIGSPAVAEVVRVEPNGHFGKKGTIELRLLYAETPSGPVRLTGRSERRGKSITGWSIAGATLVAWPLMFLHGTSGYIRQGTVVAGYFAEPLLFVEAMPEVRTTAVARPDGRPLPVSFASGVSGNERQATARR